MPEGPSVSIHGKRYQLHYFTGKVLQSLKQKETVVSGGASGPEGANPVVTSSTVDHHEFFLADESGAEQSFKTRNLDLPCREGNTVSVVWVQPERSQPGSYLKIHNHTTGQHNAVSAQQISFMFDMPLSRKALITLAVFVVATVVIDSGAGLIAAVASALFYGWRAYSGAKTLMRSDALRSLEAQLLQKNGAGVRAG